MRNINNINNDDNNNSNNSNNNYKKRVQAHLQTKAMK